MFVYLMKNIKPVSEDLIRRHVDYLKELKSKEKLVLCGPFSDYPGGMVVLKADDLAEAFNLASSDPFISSGCKSFELRTLEEANEANGYLLSE